jgi:hypothetical protein
MKTKKRFARTDAGAVNGAILGDTFIRDVRREKHFVWKYQGYGLCASEAESLPAAGVQWMTFDEKDTGVSYTVRIEDFLANGIRDRLGGFELQIFMPVSSMTATKPMNIQSSTPTGATYKATGKKVPRQLSLFGGYTHADR